MRKKEDIKLVETQMHLIKAPYGKPLFASAYLHSAREAKSDQEQEITVEEMDVEMENLEAKMNEAEPSTSKKIVRRKKLLAKK